MLIRPFKKHLYSIILLLFIPAFKGALSAQTITDSLLHKIAGRFETQEDYKLETIIQSVNTRNDGRPPDINATCFTGKEMLAVAVFGFKPLKLFARMVVTKHYNKKTAFDEHLFQDAAFDESLNIYYALLQVAFPAEVNSINCGANLQVYDKSNPSAKVWLLIFSK